MYIFFILLLFLTLVAADEYQLTFVNKADNSDGLLPNVVKLAIYQEWPTNPELVSVAWKKGSAAYEQIAVIEWDYNFNAMLINYTDKGGVGVFYNDNFKSLPADITDVFEVLDDENIQILEKTPKSGDVGTITIENNSKEKANIGLGIDGVLSAVSPKVLGGIDQIFRFNPKFWVAAYQNLEIGNIISEVQTIGDPKELIFPPGKYKATATLTRFGDVLKIDLTIDDD